MQTSFLCLLLVALPLTASANASLEPLLSRLAEVEAQRAERATRQSVTVRTVTEVLTEDGRVKSQEERVQRRTSRNGTATAELVLVVEDGKDRTQEAQKAAKETKAGDVDLRLWAQSPFAKSEQPRYRFVDRGADPARPERRRIGFAPKTKLDESVFTGEALVDASSGEVLEWHGSPSRLPTFVNAKTLRLTFAPQVDGRLELSQLQVVNRSGLPFFKKRVRSTSTFVYDAVASAPTP